MINILLSLIAGVLYALSFAPTNWWPLSMLSLAILFSVWLVSTPKLAAWSGFCFGLGMFGVGISWIYISIHTYGDMPVLAAGFSVFLGVALVSVYPALCGWCQAYFAQYRPAFRLIVVMPLLWILFEWLRGWLLTGFPWLSTGYAYLDTPLSNYAPIGGVYLVGLIAVLSTGVLVAAIRHISIATALFSGLFVVVWIGGWQLNETAWTRSEGEPISTAIIQNNLPLSEKWDEAEVNNIVSGYLAKSRQYQNADLIVWPEAAVPEYLDKVPVEFWSEIESLPADFIFGILFRDKRETDFRYYNSVAAVSDRIMIYRKQHLVPFGEYFPVRGILGPLIEMLNMPMSDFSAWQSPQAPLTAAGIKVAVSICFEDAFPNDWRNQVRSAGVLLNVSEDIWFGDSFAPHQRLQMARFRSRESERPMIRSSNNGLSSLINWKGGIDTHAPQFVEYVVTGQVQPRSGVTPYIAYGNSPALLLMGLIFIIGLVFGRQQKR